MNTSKFVTTTFIIGLAVFAAACPDKNQINSNANTNKTATVAPTPPEKANNSKMKSSPGADGAPFELQFIDTMIAHHEVAIAMAKEVEGKLQHPELNAFAKSVVAEQEKEIAEMKKWRAAWYPVMPPAINMEMPGMDYSMTRVNMDTLRAATGSEKDVEFMSQLIPHHQGSLMIANAGLHQSEKTEIHKLSESIINTRAVEMKKMQDWQYAWIKPN